MIKGAVVNILLAVSGITDVVGTNVWPTLAPQETDFPFIVVKGLNLIPMKIKGRASPNDDHRFQVDVYCKTISQVNTLFTLIRENLDQYSGTVNGLVIDRIVFEGSEDSEFDDKVEIHATSLEFNARIIN